ncbi:TetR/AcrR family transcriptional regulator [Arthrobacter sp. ISL-48]|uniref:TetR/AcrR family transcriptional regulator n=1 Tax=Arthrobacter sp. ISL-48 TaxID=2819110 RepID=UPI001BE50057|nr:TetR/AcrR family transcriptional regulator [Arthrobacter sp. ISL-48]MBT2534131.1 TetR/AcrR family transcriptional regulator [Arthrobacter sp. ISL-48]
MTVQTKGGGTPRTRVIAAAETLFLERGVHATSLQMIADRIGVTKAAVYFQFRSKNEIVRAVIAPAIARITEMVTIAEAEESAVRRFDMALDGLVGVVIEQGEVAAMLRLDAEVSEMVEDDSDFRSLMARLDGLLVGPEPSQDAKVALALAGGGLMAVGSDPTWKRLHADELRRTLRETVHRVLGPYRPLD